MALQTDRAIAQVAPTTASPSGVQGVDAATVLIVNPVTGDDATADGSDRAPFKTITQALKLAQRQTVIQLMPGTYSAETGESFPLQLKPGTVIQGNASTRGSDVIIRGSGFFLSPTFARQNVTILGANQAGLVGVTVTNPHAQGYGLWAESTSPVVTDSTFTASGHDGISLTGNSAALIRNNFFYQNGANGMTIYGTARPEVRENIFEQTGFAININQNAIPLIVGNRITQNKDGIVVQAKAKPVLRNNSIEGNLRDGLVAIAQSYPDLGTATEPGGNFIRNNGQFDVNAQGIKERLLVLGNELTKTAGMVDTSGSDPSITPVAGNLDMVNAPAAIASAPDPVATTPMPPVSVRATAAPISQPTIDFQKPLPQPTAPKAPVSAIPFGDRLAMSATSGSQVQPTPALPVPVTPVTVTQETPQVPSISTQTPAAAGLSASAFPAPSRPATASVPLVAVPVDTPVEPSFPVPTTLTGKTDTQPRRPLQIVRMPVAVGNEAGNYVVQSEPERVAQPGRGTAIAPPGTPESPPITATTTPAPFPTPVALRSVPPVRVSVAPQTVPSTPIRYQPPASQLPVTTSRTAIPIPVPAPERVAAVPVPVPVAAPVVPAPISRPASLLPNPVKPVTLNRPVPIPVPLPESGSAAPPIAVKPQPKIATQPTSGAIANLLPVPSANIPLGNVGNSPEIRVYGRSAQGDGSGPPVPPTRAALANVRYRVVVDASDDSQQSRVRSIIPEAFVTSLKGRTVLQVGAFGDRVRADDLVQSLSSQGLNATIETMD